MIVGLLLGVIALGGGVMGLWVDSLAYLVVMMADIALLWLVTVVHRLFAATTTSRRMTTA